MPEGKSDFGDGVVDVGIILHSVFNNPLKEMSISFLESVLSGDRRAALPVSSIIGAYHIATRYLKMPRVPTRKILGNMLLSGSDSLYQDIAVDIANDGLDYASTYSVESWDGFLIALSRSLGSNIV